MSQKPDDLFYPDKQCTTLLMNNFHICSPVYLFWVATASKYCVWSPVFPYQIMLGIPREYKDFKREIPGICKMSQLHLRRVGTECGL